MPQRTALMFEMVHEFSAPNEMFFLLQDKEHPIQVQALKDLTK